MSSVEGATELLSRRPKLSLLLRPGLRGGQGEVSPSLRAISLGVGELSLAWAGARAAKWPASTMLALCPPTFGFSGTGGPFFLGVAGDLCGFGAAWPL